MLNAWERLLGPVPADVSLNLKATPIAGGSAGNHTVTGIKVGDEIAVVLVQDDTTKYFDDEIADEFTITADDTINNTGGTDTTSHHLVILWWDKTT